MKLQHLAIVFVIIILPITLVVSAYVQSQIDTITLQTTYSSKLQTATYDAIKAFQLNTINNKYSTVSDSKIRDIEASISTFYDSLGSELGASGYDEESLQQFIPAIVYTMYDGYYIYGKYYNYYKGEYQYGLKPYIYYSCRYVKGTTDDFVVNYTLDNNITVYGKVNGSYTTKSGALINPNAVEQVNERLIRYGTDSNKVNIEPEILKEQLIILDDNKNAQDPTYYEYVTFNQKKVYYDGGESYFWYTNNKKQYITDPETLNFVRHWTYQEGDGYLHLHSNSAIEYFRNAKEFSIWVNSNISSIRQSDAKEVNGADITDFAVNTGDEKIFDLSDANDPLIDSSTFNQNRISVIRRTIQTTLNTAIANYSSSANYEFALPVFTEEDWDKLVNNIAVASFMQGIPIGGKYYNNYCIITNNKNKELITKDSIYLITQNVAGTDISNHDNEVHKPASIELFDKLDSGTNILGAYKNIDFETQTVVITEGNEVHYYPHANNRCYNCMVNVTQAYNLDDIIVGKVKAYNKSTDEFDLDVRINNLELLRQTYLTALAREKYDLYRTNSYFGTN